MHLIDFHPRLLLAYTTKADGNVDFRFDAKKTVTANREKVFADLNLDPKSVIEGQQIHSDRILSLNQDNAKMWIGQNIPGVDGFLTDQTDIALMVRLADCAAVVVYDPTHHAIALVHAGWQGAVKNIHLKAIKEMARRFDSDPKDLMVWISPSIKACCYLVDDKPEQSESPEWQPFITSKEGKWQIDLPGYLTSTLKSAGIVVKHLTLDPLCTYDETDTLFSYRRSQATKEPEGRIGVIVKLKP